MSETAIATTQSTGIVDIDAAIAARALALKSNITLSGNFIAIQKNGRFKMPSGEERDSIEAVVLDYRYRNQFFPKPYVKGQFSEAVCYAVGSANTGMVPATGVPEQKSDSCDTCKMNEFGSALNGGRGKACQNQLLVAIMMPDLGESEEIFILKASPTAVKAVNAYLVNMTEQSGLPLKVISKFTIETGEYQKLQVVYGGPNSDYSQHFAHVDAAARMLEAVPRPAADNAETTNTAVDAGKSRGGARKRG